MGIHDGHRGRMKRRFLEHGADVFDDHQLLELLLFFSVPQMDTNPMAHQLINHFGSLAAVFDASVDDLMKVKGVGEHTATLIHLVTPMFRRYMLSKASMETIINSTEAAGEFLLPYFYGARNETVYMLSLDAKGKVLSCDCLGEGNLNTASVDNRKVVEIAIAHRASMVILAHNHTSGLAIPSQEDIVATHTLRQILASIQVELKDHLVIADEDYVSMVESGSLTP